MTSTLELPELPQAPAVVVPAPGLPSNRVPSTRLPSTRGRARWLARPVRGGASRPGDDPTWARPALLALLAATAVLYLWDLGASGYANTFYSAAVQAGSHSWQAFFFGSSDAASFITVDKPPASLWVMDLSARVFGVNAWSILVPQALEGVAAVGVLYAAVRRVATPQAGLLAGAVLATTPVAVLMFRFDNPDALLVLLLTLAGYAMVRALEGERSTRWLLLAGGLIGTGFLTKMLQAFLVVPGFALVYLVLGPHTAGRRVRQLLLAGLSLLAASSWWVAIVQLLPASDRPYIGGSQDNSLLDLIFGYNGFGRLSGNETGSVGGGAGATGGGFWGSTGVLRLLNTEFGGQVAYLLPAALLLLGGGVWLTRRASRTNRLRASLLLWGSWLVVTGLTLSFGAGIIHPYYAVALAPAIGALVGLGGAALWATRGRLGARVVLAGAIAATAWMAVVLLRRSPTLLPGLRPAIVVVAALAVAGVLLTAQLRGPLAAPVALAAVLVGLAAPLASAVETAGTPHRGSIPSAGPAVVGGRGGPGGGFGRGLGGGPFGQRGPRGLTGQPGAPPGGLLGGAAGAAPGGGLPGAGGFRGFGGGNAGGLLDGSTPGAALAALLRSGADGYTWTAAAVGSNSAAGYQLASGKPVAALGGFNGTDPYPTLSTFQAMVAAHRVHYFLGSGGFGGGFGGGTASAISSWVAASFTATTVGGVTVYDLSRPDLSRPDLSRPDLSRPATG